MILLTKPFTVGDYIVDAGTGKEGTVKEIQSRADEIVEDLQNKGDEIVNKIQGFIDKQKS